MNFIQPGSLSRNRGLPDNAYPAPTSPRRFSGERQPQRIGTRVRTLRFVDTRNADGEPVDAEKAKSARLKWRPLRVSPSPSSKSKRSTTTTMKMEPARIRLGLGTEGFAPRRH